MHLRYLYSVVLIAIAAFTYRAFADDEPADDVAPIVTLLELLLDDNNADAETTKKCLGILAEKVQTRELSAERLAALRPRLEKSLTKITAGPADHPLHLDAVLLTASWKNADGVAAALKMLQDAKLGGDARLRALAALVSSGEARAIEAAAARLADIKGEKADFRAKLIETLGRSDEPRVAVAILSAYAQLEADLQPKAIELLTQRTPWSLALLEAIEAKKISPSVVNVNQVRKLMASTDARLAPLVRKHWSSVRTERNPQREQVIAEVREAVRRTPGDPHRGGEVFKKLCGQCHKIYGEGQEVGPDVTVNGRASYEQLLSNVLDPSLVIGTAYQAVDVQTESGRTLSGLLVEDNAERVVLKTQGGKLEVIARDEVESQRLSKLSLMPEGVEKQLKPDELADLIAYLCLDKPPSDPEARPIPGGGAAIGKRREK